MALNISQWLVKAGAYIAGRTGQPGRIDAEVLLGLCNGKDRTGLYRDGLEELSPAQEIRFWQLVERRAGGEPLAYITGCREFMGLEFLVSPDVLIPRPETELLVEKAVEALRNNPHCQANGNLTAVDVGTGSGAIAVSLALMVNCCKVYAIDLSPKALELARKNAVRHGVGDRIEFKVGDLLGPVKEIPGFRADLIAANLPYVPSPEIPLLMADVKDYEPRSALDGGPDGLDCYRRLVAEVPGMLRQGGCLLMEIAPGQGAPLKKMLGSGWKTEAHSDLAGRERLVVAQRM